VNTLISLENALNCLGACGPTAAARPGPARRTLSAQRLSILLRAAGKQFRPSSIALFLALTPCLWAQGGRQGEGSAAAKLPRDLVAQWNLHLDSSRNLVENLTGGRFRVIGAIDQVAGPVGDALEFDGYTSAIRGEPLEPLAHHLNMTVVCWIQLEAYPWNELPIIDQRNSDQKDSDPKDSDRKDSNQKNSDRQNSPQDPGGRFFFGLDGEGHLVARIGGGSERTSLISTEVVPLRTWTLVALSIDREGQSTFIIGGKPSPSQSSPGVPGSGADVRADAEDDLLIGHVREPLLPGPAPRIHPQFPIEYSLQGSLGGLAVYGHALSQDEVDALMAAADKRLIVPTPWPKFPRGMSDRRTFGAFYTTLHFDPVWERSRRIAPDSDVVVQFDNAPIQLVFWQGANYVPAWVTENDRWYTDEFMEVYGNPRCPDGEDCEPMSDKQERYSHVRILENTPARAVIHWRYALSEVEKYDIADSATIRDWGDWADEYWTVYPDGIAVRKSVLWSKAAGRDKTEFQESIILIPPGETPEDNLNFNALTFANLKGESATYRWQPKTTQGLALPRGPVSFSEPSDAVIQWVNLKSEWKPFQVAWGNNVKFTAYNSEYSISSFEWWNHWPVAQIASSGRPALAADRPGHTSVSHIYWPIYDKDEQRVTKILLDGLTRSAAAELAPIAASWRNPAQLELEKGTNVPYDPAQRAYVFPATAVRILRMTLHATPASPVVDPAFVVPGWQGHAEMRVVRGADSKVHARLGYVTNFADSSLVVYLPLTATGDLVLELRPE
jgi:Concanavalin A-like lectin/glucanases superfamily